MSCDVSKLFTYLTENIDNSLQEVDVKKVLKNAATTAAIGSAAFIAGDAADKGTVAKPIVADKSQTRSEVSDAPLNKDPHKDRATVPLPVEVDMNKIVQIESSGNPEVPDSPAGARGLTQIMPDTWTEMTKKMGMPWSWEEAHDPEKNLQVGTYYMNTEIPRLLNAFGIEDIVTNRLIAYDWGIGNFSNALTKVNNVEDLLLPTETEDYIAKYNSVDAEITESTIDFPRQGLDPKVWKKVDGLSLIQPYVKKRILSLLGLYPYENLLAVADGVNVVGSIGTNLYTDDADIDVHLRMPEGQGDAFDNDDRIKRVMRWFNNNRDKINGWVGQHPIEVYMQFDHAQDLMSDSYYDLLNDEWKIGPKIVDQSYDPYEDFGHVVDDIRNSVENADKLLGELHRDVIDYETIKAALEEIPKEQRETLAGRLQWKIEEIETDIRDLYSERGEWVAARHNASKPATSEEALKDTELAKQWKDTNATFKFINRYNYLRVINDLEALIADDELSAKEIDLIGDIV